MSWGEQHRVREAIGRRHLDPFQTVERMHGHED